jgi:hypothetical protein
MAKNGNVVLPWYNLVFTALIGWWVSSSLNERVFDENGRGT